VSPLDDNMSILTRTVAANVLRLVHLSQVHEGFVYIYEGIEVVLHILIADEFYQRTLIREALAGDPTFSFAEATNGAEALELIWQQQPDLVILDLLMPDMGGLQVCRIMKGKPSLAAIPVIVITAFPTDEHRVGARGAGADHFLTKPFDNAELLKIVQQALRERKH
jgi:CheY-like chemotaxis protein